MSEEEFAALRTTFPWREVSIRGHRGGPNLRIVNVQMQEIDLLQMCAFLEMITTRLAGPTESKESE